MRGRVGALAALPLPPLTGTEAQGDHGGDPLRLQPRVDSVVGGPPLEEDRLELAIGHLEVVEGRPDGGESAPVPRVKPQGGDETVVGEENEGFPGGNGWVFREKPGGSTRVLDLGPRFPGNRVSDEEGDPNRG